MAAGAPITAGRSAPTASIKNRSGIEIKPLYTPRDWNGDGFLENLGFPGQYPYTRGIYPTMHRGRTWTQRQLIGLGTPEDYNKRVRTILDAGATAISLIPCNSGFRGNDCDEVDPAAARHLRHGRSTPPITWIGRSIACRSAKSRPR